MKLITLMENTALPGFAAEHGLSLYLEAAGKRILFDAGQSGAFADNARKLGVDLSAVDAAVLSHGHYDHGGGMARFRAENDHAPIYVSGHAFGTFYHGPEKYIGLPQHFPRDGLRTAAVIAPGLTLVPCAGASNPAMLVKTPEGFQRDDFRHEQSLLVEEGETRILITGCAHCGVLNLLETFRPNVLIGGFHLKGMDREAVIQTAQAMANYDTQFFTGHCTGAAQFAVLKAVLGDRVQPIRAGTIINEKECYHDRQT